MTTRSKLLLAVLMTLPVVASGCGSGVAEDEGGPSPVSVSRLEGTNTDVLELTPRAVERLAIQTAAVRGDGSGSMRTRIPYAAVLYDPDGQTWTYTSPRRDVFVRKNIVVDRVDHGMAILGAGPPVGAKVVTVGSTELWGVVYGGIHED